MKILGIIPARYASTRLPGKPLMDILGKTMIQRTFEQASKALDYVVVATDDDRIIKEVEHFGGNAVMTSKNHKTGTDRCAEAEIIYSEKLGIKFDVVINIQGDEPYISPKQITELVSCFNEPSSEIGTLAIKIEDYTKIFNENTPKVIFDKNYNAIYFSRSPIPFVRGEEKENWLKKHTFYKHIGMYGYRSDILQKLTKLEATNLELAESLEQNRWIENGYKLKVFETKIETISVDTAEDLEKAKQMINMKNL